MIEKPAMLNWFVFRCPFGKEIALRGNIQSLFGVECFIPIEKVRQRDKHGRFVWKERCALTGYLFVHTEKEMFTAQDPCGTSDASYDGRTIAPGGGTRQ